MSETVKFNGREYQKFIQFPKAVRDGTFRCIACGQIDGADDFEDGTNIHDPSLCPACPQYRAARKEPT